MSLDTIPSEERTQWLAASHETLAEMYGTDEPDYNDAALKETDKNANLTNELDICFKSNTLSVGKKSWTREDLHD